MRVAVGFFWSFWELTMKWTNKQSCIFGYSYCDLRATPAKMFTLQQIKIWIYFRGNQCVNCAQPFVYSSVSFEILPLVEFELEPGITDKEALWLIESESKSSKVTNRIFVFELCFFRRYSSFRMLTCFWCLFQVWLGLVWVRMILQGYRLSTY